MGDKNLTINWSTAKTAKKLYKTNVSALLETLQLIGKHDYRMDYAKRTGVEKTIKYTEIHRLKHSNKFHVCIYSVRAENTLSSLISHMNSYAYFFLA